MCISQASMFNALRSRLIRHGFTNIEYNIVNMLNGAKDLEKLQKVSPDIPIHQETPEDKTVESLSAGKDHFLIIDKCNRLVYRVILPWSLLNYPFVKSAILSAYNDEPCGGCGEHVAEEMQTTFVHELPLPAVLTAIFVPEDTYSTHKHHQHMHHHHKLHHHKHHHHSIHHHHGYPHNHHHVHHHHNHPVYHNFEGNEMSVNEQYDALRLFLLNHLLLLNIKNDTFEVHSEADKTDYKKFLNAAEAGSTSVSTASEHDVKSEVFGNTFVHTDELTKIPYGTDPFRVEKLEGNAEDHQTVSKDEILSQNSPPLLLTIWYPHYHVDNGQRLKDHYFVVLNSKDPKYHGHIVPDEEQGEEFGNEREHTSAHGETHIHHEGSQTETKQTGDSSATHGVNVITGAEHTSGGSQFTSAQGQNSQHSYSYNTSHTETHHQTGSEIAQNEVVIGGSQKTDYHGKDTSIHKVEESGGHTSLQDHEKKNEAGHGHFITTDSVDNTVHLHNENDKTKGHGTFHKTEEHTIVNQEKHVNAVGTDTQGSVSQQGHGYQESSQTNLHGTTSQSGSTAHGDNTQSTSSSHSSSHGSTSYSYSSSSSSSSSGGHQIAGHTSGGEQTQTNTIHTTGEHTQQTYGGSKDSQSSHVIDQGTHSSGQTSGTHSIGTSESHGTHSTSNIHGSTSHISDSENYIGGSHKTSDSASVNVGGQSTTTHTTHGSHSHTTGKESSSTHVISSGKDETHTTGIHGSTGGSGHVSGSHSQTTHGAGHSVSGGSTGSGSQSGYTTTHTTGSETTGQSSGSHTVTGQSTGSQSHTIGSGTSQTTSHTTGSETTTGHTSGSHTVTGQSTGSQSHTTGSESTFGQSGSSQSTSHTTGSETTGHSSGSHSVIGQSAGSQSHVTGSEKTDYSSSSHTTGVHGTSHTSGSQVSGSHSTADHSFGSETHTTGGGSTSGQSGSSHGTSHTSESGKTTAFGSGSHTTGSTSHTSQTTHGHSQSGDYQSGKHEGSSSSHHSETAGHGSSYEASHGSSHLASHGASHGSSYEASHGSSHGASHGASHGSSYEASHGSSHGASHGASHGSSHGSSYEASHGSSHGASHGSSSSGKHGEYDDRIIFRDEPEKEFDFQKYVEKAYGSRDKTHSRSLDEEPATPEEKAEEEKMKKHYSKILPWIKYPVD